MPEIVPYQQALEQWERQYWTDALIRCDLNVANLARLAGINRTWLYRKLIALGISIDQLRRENEAPLVQPLVTLTAAWLTERR